jgi:glycosyltransferase involved in cell wall biosynthesis
VSVPSLSIAVLSWNRLHYLRATLESARRCIRHPRIEWIVSDNESIEPGLRDYVEGLGWVQHKWFKTQSHAAAMNEIVERASGDYLIIWPEDVQFVVEGDWMLPLLETLEQNPWVGSVGMNFLRRKTLRRLLGPPGPSDAGPILGELKRGRLRASRTLPGLRTFGWRLPGVIGSGIPSLTRRSAWQALGPWKISDPSQSNIIDSSLGAEDYMIARFQASGQAWHQATLTKPVAADIINDDLGCKAKIRKGKRYGRYTPPASGDFYYEIRRDADLPAEENGLPLSFENHVRPIGFNLPLDANGDMLKTSIDMSIVNEILPR